MLNYGIKPVKIRILICINDLLPMPRITETRISKLSGGLSDVRLCEAVLKAFYAQDLQELQRLLQLVKGREYQYKFHKLTQRGQGSRISESGLWDLSFAFLEGRG
jgi:hypothetical protein